MVPKVIYMTYKNKRIPKKYILQWKKLNPDYEIKFYTDEDCINFLKKEYGKKYSDFFKWIKYGAHKADFWRYCILYKYGGVYADIDLVPYLPINKIIGDSNFCTCIGIDKCSFFQAFLVTPPNNPLIYTKQYKVYLKKKYFQVFGENIKI